jgi:hypothetical protein
VHEPLNSAQERAGLNKADLDAKRLWLCPRRENILRSFLSPKIRYYLLYLYPLSEFLHTEEAYLSLSIIIMATSPKHPVAHNIGHNLLHPFPYKVFTDIINRMLTNACILSAATRHQGSIRSTFALLRLERLLLLLRRAALASLTYSWLWPSELCLALFPFPGVVVIVGRR